MDYYGQVLENVDRRFAEIRRMYEKETALDISWHNRKARLERTPLHDHIRGKPKCPKGLNPHVHALAWANRQHDDKDKSWTALVRKTDLSYGGLQNEVKKFKNLGGEVEGTIMNSLEVSLHAVTLLAKRLGVGKPCDDDLVRWLRKKPDDAFIMGPSKSATEIREYAMRRGLIKKGLVDMGFTPAGIRDLEALLGKKRPAVEDVRGFLESHDDTEQERIAGEKGIRSAPGLLAQMRSVVGVSAEMAKEKRLHDEATAQATGAVAEDLDLDNPLEED